MQPLDGISVVELAGGVRGPYAGKLFADFGADVLKVEPVDGDPARREGARPGERPDVERSPLFAHLNTNKRSAVLDPSDAADAALLDRLVAAADLVIHDGTGGWPSAQELREQHPGLVVTSVSAFGTTGPMAGTPGNDLIAYAAGGPLHATGLAEREPIKLAGRVVEYQCGAVAAVASLAGVSAASASGSGMHIDVSNFETQAGSIDRRMALQVGHTFTGRIGQRQGGNREGIVPAGIYPNEDGYCQIVFAPNWLERVAEMLGHEQLIEHLAAPDWMDDPELPGLMSEAVFTWTVQRTKQQAMEDAQARQLAVMPLNSTTDVLADEHFRERGFWQTVDHPTLGRYESPGPQVRMRDGWALRRPAPALGEHTESIRHHPPAVRSAPPGTSPEARLPLEGVRVLDLTVVWAGPLATMLLGDLGAEVIRLDNPLLFPTATRGAIPRPRPGHEADLGQFWSGFPDSDGGERPWNRVAAFLIHARGKKSATLDARKDLGRETLLRLVKECDVFVENNSVKVLEQLGLDWATLREINPRLILLRMPSLGLDGPYRDYIGFGAHMEALCGLTSLRGYTDLDPSSLDATYFMDPASGAAGAFAVMAALRRRDRTGDGELIELAQAENLLNYVGEYVIDASLTGRPHDRHGNRHPHRAPQGVYPCAGDNRWIAISVEDDDQWTRLVELMGSPDWADDGLATETARRERHDELDGRLAEWTASFDRVQLATMLTDAAITSSAVLDEADLATHPHLAARRFFRPNSSADVPEAPFPGHLWRWDGPPLAWGELNVMGRDNDEVYRGILGLTDNEMAALDADGHLSGVYHAPDGTPY